MFFVQSIMLPRGSSLADLAGKSGLEWLSDASEEKKQEFDDYLKYEQQPVEKFDSTTLSLLKLDGVGAYALVGSLQGEPEGEMLSLAKEQLEQVEKITSVLDAPIEEAPPVQGVVRTFREVFEREIFSMMDVIHGTLRQSGQKAAVRKKTILGAIDAFRSFMSMSLDSIGKESVELGKLDAARLDKTVTPDQGGEMLFDTEEKFVEATTKVVKTVLADVKKAEEDAQAAATAKAKKEADDAAAAAGKTVNKGDTEEGGDKDPLVEIRDSVKDLAVQVKAVVEKQETFASQILTGRVGDDEVDDALVDDKNKSKPSVFGGLLVKSQEKK